MEKTYNPQDIDSRFTSTGKSRATLSLMAMKPGKFLHHDPAAERHRQFAYGHAFQQTIMDTMIRYQRMQGKTPCGRSVLTTQGSLPRWSLAQDCRRRR